MRPALAATLFLLALFAQAPEAVRYVDVALQAGIKDIFYCGSEKTKNYIVETLGSGAAFIDYDNDGYPDLFVVNGSRQEKPDRAVGRRPVPADPPLRGGAPRGSDLRARHRPHPAALVRPGHTS